MAHPDSRRVTVHMTVKTFFATIGDPDWSSTLESQQAGVHLQTNVFTSAEGATNTAQDQPNFVLRDIETGGDLFSIFV